MVDNQHAERLFVNQSSHWVVSMFGSRLRAAREIRGLSLRALADIVGVSHTAIHKYETGAAMPDSAILLRISAELGVGLGHLMRQTTVELKDIQFRKRSRFSKKAERRVRGAVSEFLERYLAAESLLTDVDKPFTIPEASRVAIDRLEQIEQIAAGVRSEWNLGQNPISNLIETLEERAVKIVLIDVNDERFDGCSLWLNERSPVIVISKSEQWPGDRQRLTAAHELGHLLLDGDIDSGLDREAVAYRFAGAFLMPRESVLQELGEKRSSLTVRELQDLKLKYGISMAAVVRRARDLSIISERYYSHIMRVFSRYSWRKHEPDPQVEPEHPRRLERLVYRLYVENIISESRAAELLATSMTELRLGVETLGKGNRLAAAGG